ncbi:MAG: FRG domain-containing protein [Acidobacteria bacterium]|nr:FRG domain-containing protein [Acidobacteriota bacterium]
MAADLKRQGKYDWFRGQVQNWPLKSSFVRIGKNGEQEALERAKRFINWAKSTPGLEALVKNVDATCAVAQHYGIPTNYVDFTTSPDIAGFFAADNPNDRPLNGDSCILCLNTSDLKEFWRHLPSEYPPPEFIEVEVPNLWRLEAQEGRFLFCAYDKFENFYDLDRILFPYTGPVKTVSRQRIYPQEKSALEILLDQFFMNERLLAGTPVVQSLPWARKMTIEDQGGWSREFVPNGIPLLSSWQTDLRPWIESSRETYSEVSAGQAIMIHAQNGSDPLQSGEALRDKIGSYLAQESSARKRAIAWRIEGDGVLPKRLTRLDRALRWLWDGIRALPYSDEQIADSVGRCLALWQAGAEERDPTAFENAARVCLGDSMEVEFGASDGAYSRAFVSRTDLLHAVRNDVGTYLNPRVMPQITTNMTGLLQAIQEPSRLFEFAALANVFVRQLAPCQVLYRSTSTAAFFSPARLDRFGLC